VAFKFLKNDDDQFVTLVKLRLGITKRNTLSLDSLISIYHTILSTLVRRYYRKNNRLEFWCTLQTKFNIFGANYLCCIYLGSILM